MLTYEVTSASRRVIDGLGVFEAGETKTFGEAEEAFFASLRGVRLNQGNVPDDVQVVIKVQEVAE